MSVEVETALVGDGLLASYLMNYSYWCGEGLLRGSQHHLEDQTISAFSLSFFKSPFAL